MSDYSVIIQGPSGVILHAEIDANLRKVRSLALDDATLKSLLIVTSVVGGVIESEMHRRHRDGLKPELRTGEVIA